MAHLAQLVAKLPGWVVMMCGRTEIDIAPTDGPKGPGYTNEKVATLLAEFDQNVVQARAALEKITDADFDVPWTLKAGGREVMKDSRYQMMRSTVFNHIVHHRAQLGVYLRMVDVKVPIMYGPTADEKM